MVVRVAVKLWREGVGCWHYTKVCGFAYRQHEGENVMARLSWISDSDLQNAVDQLVEQTNNAKRDADERMKKNVIDPFLSLVLASTFDVDTREELVSTQQLSSALRGIGNALGTFHHQILSSVDGWIDYDAGYDIENANRRILAEIKNKHNTMDSKSRRATIQGLENHVGY